MTDLALSCEVSRHDFDRADERACAARLRASPGGPVTPPANVADACRSQFLSIREPDRRRNLASVTEKTFRRVTIWPDASSANSKHYQLYPVGRCY